MNETTKEFVELFEKQQDQIDTWVNSDEYQYAEGEQIEKQNKDLEVRKKILEGVKEESLKSIDEEIKQLELIKRKLNLWTFRNSDIRPFRLKELI